MELSNSAREIITNAQMIRMENNHKDLCVEHLLYGVFMLGNENTADGRAVKNLLSREMMNPEAAFIQLKKDAKDGGEFFEGATSVLGRATELAGGGEIGAMHLAKAVLEAKTPTVLALKGLVGFRGQSSPQQPAQPVTPPKPAGQKPGQDNKLNTRDKLLLLALLAAAAESQKQELVNNSGKVGYQKKKRHTKMGLFTYRGGTVAAAIQYFLFGILIPLALVFIVQHFTGFLDRQLPPGLTFTVGALGAIWIFYLARGVSLLFGIASSALGNFLDILCDLGLIAALVKAVQYSWALPEAPVWLRVVASIVALLVLYIGLALYEHLRDEGDVRKVKISLVNMKGTPGKIFFKYLTSALILPTFIGAVIWIFSITPANWFIKTFWILIFYIVWNIFNVGWNCLAMVAEKKRGAGKGFFRFMQSVHLFFFIPLFVLYLHWLFSWTPVKLWVLIVLGIYTVATLIISIIYARAA